MNALESPSDGLPQARVTLQLGKAARKVIPATTDQRFVTVSIPKYSPTRATKNCFFLCVSAAHRTEQLGQTRDHRSRHDPRRNFPSTSGNQRCVKKLGGRIPSNLAQYATDSRPPKAWPNDHTASNITGLRRAKWNCSRASARHQAYRSAHGPSFEVCPDIQSAEGGFVHPQKRLRKRPPTPAALYGSIITRINNHRRSMVNGHEKRALGRPCKTGPVSRATRPDAPSACSTNCSCVRHGY